MHDGANASRFTALLVVAVLCLSGSPRLTASTPWLAKLDPVLRQHAQARVGCSRVIVRGFDSLSIDALRAAITRAGGAPGRPLPGIAGNVATLPNAALALLAANPLVQGVSLDREIVGAMERTGATVGATTVRRDLGYDGTGIGVAIIDSGVAASHDDLSDPAGGHRIVQFVDFVNGRATPYDDYGHGTHVAGIVAGNGFDSNGARTGIAPGARLLVLKTLDASGHGRISDVIAAMEYAVAHRDEFNIRVLNLSVAAGVYESYRSDPLTLAAERAVSAGLVVVAAGGNNGHRFDGRTQYGGITAPGNAPWVLTVGASSHMGTIDRTDDTIPGFNSRGPGAVDYAAKPDVVAPGVGVESLAAPDSSLYTSASAFLLAGTVGTPYLPYLSLTGTSMSAPVVSGTVALMLQANPALTPNAVKAIIQYTAENHSEYDPLTQGAGFLNAQGAVELARSLTSPSNPYPSSRSWSKRLIWGNQLVRGGRLTADANAWRPGVTWGASANGSGTPVSWGILCSGSSCDTSTTPWTLSNATSRNVVWGTICAGADCQTTWTVSAVTSTTGGETVVWGTAEGAETVVWGTTGDGETVVWGTDGPSETVVWGTDIDAETVVWGTMADGESLVWQGSTSDGQTVVWGTVTGGSPVVFGTVRDGETVVWGTTCADPSCLPVIWSVQ